MHYPIEDIDSISERLRARLVRAGIKTTGQLLERAAPAQRAALVKSIGATEEEVLHAIRICDLMRVRGVGDKSAALLLAAGMTGPSAVAKAKDGALHGQLKAVRSRVPKLKRMPNPSQVSDWIKDAALLQPIVT